MKQSPRIRRSALPDAACVGMNLPRLKGPVLSRLGVSRQVGDGMDRGASRVRGGGAREEYWSEGCKTEFCVESDRPLSESIGASSL